MIVDTSAILAIVLDEPEAPSFMRSLFCEPRALVSAGAVIELAAVSTRRFNGQIDAQIEYVLATGSLTIAAVTPQHAQIAADAYRRYGIGTGHPAKLNFGDCFSYALAKATGEPLLFKGNDFTQTDVRRAVAG